MFKSHLHSRQNLCSHSRETILELSARPIGSENQQIHCGSVHQKNGIQINASCGLRQDNFYFVKIAIRFITIH